MHEFLSLRRFIGSVHGENEKAGQKEIKNVQFEKKSTRKCNIEAKACAERDKEKLDWKWNKDSDAPYSICPANPATCSKVLQNFLFL